MGLLGLLEGWELGLDGAMLEGTTVGMQVGILLGTFVAVNEGNGVGFLDGILEGVAVGIALGGSGSKTTKRFTVLYPFDTLTLTLYEDLSGGVQRKRPVVEFTLAVSGP